MESDPTSPPHIQESSARHSEERRVVTTLFCDLVGFTSFAERNDPELVDGFLRRYHAVAREAIGAYGGTVEKFIGDAIVAVFGVPVLHEDDPERAVRAGLRLVDEVDALPGVAGRAVEVRVGVNTGEALVRLDVDPALGEGFLVGDAVNVAARLQSAAPPMAVAVGEPTHSATEKVFAFEPCHPVDMKGKAKPLAAWIATEPRARTGSELRSFASEYVGREEARRPPGTARRGCPDAETPVRPHLRRARHRQDPPAGRVRPPSRRPPRADGLAPGPLPALRRQRHVLGPIGDRERRGGHRGDGWRRAY
jgi:class 3 adenylate cyclase